MFAVHFFSLRRGPQRHTESHRGFLCEPLRASAALCVAVFLSALSPLSSQETDSLKTLEPVTINAFEQNQRQNQLSSVKFIELNNAGRDNRTSFVHALNILPGVRMEERSPGSFRINIRGSSLRSPFGVRNLKVYWNGLSLTDAGGNTYFNQLAYNNFSYLEVYRGPASSMYGAGTGGLVLIHNLDRWHRGASLEYIGGSYSLHNILGSVRFGKQENRNQFSFAHQQSNGYRNQSFLRKDNFSYQSLIRISKKQEIQASLLFTDMQYGTPGALTLNEFNLNPRSARPAAGAFPSAEQAKAAIYQTNFLTGFNSTYTINEHWKNITAMYGMYNQVKNPAIRNYERRKEPGFGARTSFIFDKDLQESTVGARTNNLRIVSGAEINEGFYNILVSDNINGRPDSVQIDDDVRYSNLSIFLQGTFRIVDKWFFTSGISTNYNKVSLTRLSEFPVTEINKKFSAELSPRLEIKRVWESRYSLGIVVSKGFSPPTVGEILPSTTVINTSLQAERGWNYELNAASQILKNKLRLSLNAYYFRLNNTIVQRRDLSGADFFVNAGQTKQKGIEFTADYQEVSSSGFLELFHIYTGYGYQYFRYGDFIRGTDDFSGKFLPSVPRHTVSSLLDLQFDKGFYLEANYYFASKIFLNDANSAFAEPYHLLGCQLGWRRAGTSSHRWRIFAGVDNLLDEKYSLGNDINAPAGRFFNAAPGRNFYGGISWMLRNTNSR